MDYLYLLLILLVVYKILDRLVRIPRLPGPTARTRNILVTGCDTGFGNILAKRLAAKGYTVFAACLTDEGREKLSTLYPRLLKPFLMDVTSADSVREGHTYVCSQLKEKEGLWAIVNNAGITGYSGPTEWLTRGQVDSVMSVNFYGILQVTNRFLPLLKRTRGRLVNTCSIVGRYTLPYGAPYTSSKHAAEALSDTYRLELKPFDISVHILEPGLFLTKLIDPKVMNATTQKVWDALDPSVKEDYGENYIKESMSLVADFVPKSGSSKLSKVVDCYEHAVTAVYPRGRYMPGLDARLIYWPLSCAPEWLSDGVMNLVGRVMLPKPAGVKKYRTYYQ